LTGWDDYRDLADGQLMRERGLFVAEGRLVVRRVIDEPRYRVHSLLLNDAAHRDLADALDRLPSGTPVQVARAEAFRAITGFNFHRGCLALVHRPPLQPADAVVADQSRIVLLDDVTNADNVGGVFRNVAAFGGGAVVLSPRSCDPFYRKAIRTSMGTVLRVPFARAQNWPSTLDYLRQQGFTIAVLTPREPAETIHIWAAAARRAKIALVAGSEGDGVSAAVEAAAEVRVRIPIVSGVDSLNVAVAVGVALFTLRS